MLSRTIASTSRADIIISCGVIFNISHPHLSMFFAAVEAISPLVCGARTGRASGSPCFLSDISGWRGDDGLYPLASRASGRIRRLAPAIGDGRRVREVWGQRRRAVRKRWPWWRLRRAFAPSFRAEGWST